jgi:hypothetical protein
MKTPTEVANHPKARLHRELVAILRATGSLEGAGKAWEHLRRNARRWRRIEIYGFDSTERQAQLNKVAFPDCNFEEVDIGLEAGNRLHQLYELARGHASVARDSRGLPRKANRGVLIVGHATRTPVAKS